jgi:chromosome segregation ATPase
MCKKLFVAAIAIVAGLLVVRHTQLGSLMQVWWHDARVSMERQIPPDVKIKRLNVEIAKIDKDIQRNLSRLAGRKVECLTLEEKVADLRTKQQQLRTSIVEMEKALDSRTHKVSIQGETFTVAECTRRLDTAVNLYTNRKAELKAKEQLLEEKRKTLEEAERRINAMCAQKDELRVTVARLETQLETLKLRQMQDRVVDLDDSQVARCNELANQIKEELLKSEVEAKLYLEHGYRTPAQVIDREPKSPDEVLKAARKALQEDDSAVAGNKN